MRRGRGLSLAQRRVYDFIVQYIEDNGYSPTYGEIAHGLGYASNTTAYTHVESLLDMGLLAKKSSGPTRGIIVAG